ncbi:hypothetical protein CRUP_031304, partial [Coryphaenoides rupestris]
QWPERPLNREIRDGEREEEMDDHMRTMLHHRELEKLKGRDCGHECTVCQVTVASLTDYASHISSALHKQRVEASETATATTTGAANEPADMDYFDHALVELIEKRKELVRKEEEAAVAKRTHEEAASRRRQEFQERLREAKVRFSLNIRRRLQSSQLPPRPLLPPGVYGGPRAHKAWEGAGTHLSATADLKARTQAQQGKSATWHAQEPPNFKGFDAAGDWAGGSLGSSRGYGRDSGLYSGGRGGGVPRGRHPWLSNQGSSNGLYGQNNIPQYPQQGRPLSLVPLCSYKPSAPSPGFSRPKQFGGPDRSPAGAPAVGREGHRGRDGPVECHRGNDTGLVSPKSHGSNSKLDKACRWSPYPPTKSMEKDTPPPSCSGKYPDAAVPRKHEAAGGSSEGGFAKPAPVDGNRSGRRKNRNKNKRNRDRSSSSGSMSSSSQSTSSPAGPSEQSTDDRKLECLDRKSSLSPSDTSQPSRTGTTREKKQSRSKESKTTSSTRSLPAGPLQSRQEQQMSEPQIKPQEAALERRCSVEVPRERKREAAPPVLSSVEEPQQVCPERQAGANKENNCSQTSATDPLPDLVRPSPCGDEKMEVMPSYQMDCSQYLQSVHISTSSSSSSSTTLGTSASVVVSTSPQEDEEQGRSKRWKARSRVGEAGRDRCNKEAVGHRSLPQEQGGSFDTSDEPIGEETSQGSESDASRTFEASQHPSAPAAVAAVGPSPGLTRLGLPPVLTKHMSAKGKTGTHEPNLNIARRVRNVSEQRKGDVEKESGLKPTVRQLISSSRNVNWEQVYQEVRKKQGQGKGWPRFGIEMVSYDHEDLHTPGEEDSDMALLEGFHWDSLLDTASSPITLRKRSLSESSVVPGRPAPSSSHDMFSCLVPGDQGEGEGQEGDGLPPPPDSAKQGSVELEVFSGWGPEPTSGTQEEGPGPQDQHPGLRLAEAEPGAEPGGSRLTTEGAKKVRARVLQRSESVAVGDCSSGAELGPDAQAMGKKRRAAGDIPSPENHSLKKNKRMKIKSKRERFQVDQLLAVSLHEEELSLTLQGLETGLIQARAALQAAYLEVQRITVLKQQVTTEMGTLRNQRIDLLKGIQGGFEDPAAPPPQVKQENPEVDSPESSALAADVSLPSPSTDQLPLPASQPATPSASSSTPMPPPIAPLARVKQEPLDQEESKEDLVHSSTPELPPPPPPLPTTCLPDPAKLQGSPDCRGPSANQTSLSSPPHTPKDGGPSPMLDRATQADQLDSKLHLQHPLSHRRTSETGNHGGASTKSKESAAAMPTLPATLSPVSAALTDTKKRVRKLRKRRVLNKATQGAEPTAASAVATSDTEADEEDTGTRTRRQRPRRRSSAGSLVVSTSTPPTAPEDEEQETEARVAVAEEEEEEEESGVPAARPAGAEEEFDSALEMVDICSEVVNVEVSESEDSMEVTVACQQPPAPAGPGVSPALGLPPDLSRAEMFNLACNEVTSTSDMDTSPAVKPYQRSSNVSSDPGEDEVPTEGAFEGHKEAVNGLQIHKGLLYTCSGDRTVKAFDLVSHQWVNDLVFSGSSDQSVHAHNIHIYTGCYDGSVQAVQLNLLQNYRCMWHGCSLIFGVREHLQQHLAETHANPRFQSLRCRWRNCDEFFCARHSSKQQTRSLELQFSLADRVLCLHSRWKVLYAGMANGTVVTFDLKRNKQQEVFDCHGPRAVSCLASAQEGARKLLLVGSYDSTISVRDARNGLLLRTLGGHTKTVLCMKVVNDLVFSGSSDQSVHAHNIHTGELVRVYKGHSHAVTVVAILGTSHDRLQVYGGHRDMVMCMAVHKSMIYTGCYDGSVQAVQLNLLQNYRCMWHGCSLIFGVREHLQQHLAETHANPRFQSLRCRWRNCDEFFCARHSSKQQGVLTHMQKHTEEALQSDP